MFSNSLFLDFDQNPTQVIFMILHKKNIKLFFAEATVWYLVLLKNSKIYHINVNYSMWDHFITPTPYIQKMLKMQ